MTSQNIEPIYPVTLPQYKQFFYDPNTQAIGYAYDNGGMMTIGNNISARWEPLSGVIIDLLRRIEHLERSIKELTNDQPKQ